MPPTERLVATLRFPAADLLDGTGVSSSQDDSQTQQQAGGSPQDNTQTPAQDDKPKRHIHANGEVDENGKPIRLEQQQPKRILGFMPNYRSVSGGVKPPPPSFKQNFKVATRQSFDYSAFVFLGITSLTAYGQDSHPAFNTLNGGNAVLWSYLWRGFVDKTDGTYQSAFILPTLLHEDTRYYAMGTGSKWKRLAYSATRVVVARTYSGHNTPNIAGIGGKIGTQAVSTTYYPANSQPFSVLATKFSYSVARDMGLTIFREFYPDIAVHVLHRAP